jgi:outer membrane protein TolC
VKSSLLTLGVILLLAGCSSTNEPCRERSVTEVLSVATVAKDTRPEALPVVTTVPDVRVDDWWTRFGDDTLTRLIEKAHDANHTLAAARANLAAAQAMWEYQRGGLFPQVDAGGDLTRSRTSDNGLSGRNRYTNYNLAATARWELDLFGRQRHLMNAAEAQAEATEAELKAMWVSVSAAVANAYLELRTLQGRLMVAEDNLKLQQANYDLQADRTAGGLTNELVKNQAEYDLRSTSATIPSIKAQIVAIENSLAILCGVTPGTLPTEIFASTTQTMDVGTASEQDDGAVRPAGLRPTGIPQPELIPLDMGFSASALRRRPDVIAAERILKATVEEVDAAKAERYPDIYITAALGLESIHIGDLMDWESHFYRFGPGVTLPIFRGGQITANIKMKTEAQRAAFAQYEETVLLALSDIRSAYSVYVNEQERLEQLRLGVQAAQAAYEIASNKYNAGLGDFFDVLDAQRKLFLLDEARVVSEGAIAASQVALYKSLCGGWEGEASVGVANQLFGNYSDADPLLKTIEPAPAATEYEKPAMQIIAEDPVTEDVEGELFGEAVTE